jgi:hypothetical protein
MTTNPVNKKVDREKAEAMFAAEIRTEPTILLVSCSA